MGNVGEAARYIRSHAKARPNVSAAVTIPPVPSADCPITPAYLFHVLNKVMPRDAVIAEECPSSKGDLDRHVILDEPGSFYSVPNGVLGFGVAGGGRIANGAS